jgi:hypothetical protein
LQSYALRFWLSDERETAPEILAVLKEKVSSSQFVEIWLFCFNKTIAKLPNSPLVYMMSGWQALITDHDSNTAIQCYRRGHELVQPPQLKVE